MIRLIFITFLSPRALLLLDFTSRRELVIDNRVRFLVSHLYVDNIPVPLAISQSIGIGEL